MGSGIASHVANAGVAVYLLDVPAKSGESRNRVAEQSTGHDGTTVRLCVPVWQPTRQRKRIVESNEFDYHTSVGVCPVTS